MPVMIRGARCRSSKEKNADGGGGVGGSGGGNGAGAGAAGGAAAAIATTCWYKVSVSLQKKWAGGACYKDNPRSGGSKGRELSLDACLVCWTALIRAQAAPQSDQISPTWRASVQLCSYA